MAQNHAQTRCKSTQAKGRIKLEALLNLMSRPNFLTQFVRWFEKTILGKTDPPPKVLKESVVLTLTEANFTKQQHYLAMLNKVQMLRSPDEHCISTWKITPLTLDHGVFYYLFCMEIPRRTTSLERFTLSTGTRQFSLIRSRGQSWGKHQVFGFKSERHNSANFDMLFSRNASFLSSSITTQPNLNAAAFMRKLATQLLTLPIRNVDWNAELNIAIAGWGDWEPIHPELPDPWNLDRK